MLVLSRRVGQEIAIGSQVIVRVLAIQGNRVRVGISAPDALPIHRHELLLRNALAMETSGGNEATAIDSGETGDQR